VIAGMLREEILQTCALQAYLAEGRHEISSRMEALPLERLEFGGRPDRPSELDRPGGLSSPKAGNTGSGQARSP
jgi:hypothetical protein